MAYGRDGRRAGAIFEKLLWAPWWSRAGGSATTYAM